MKKGSIHVFKWPRKLAMMAGPKERAGLMEQPVTSDDPPVPKKTRTYVG